MLWDVKMGPDGWLATGQAHCVKAPPCNGIQWDWTLKGPSPRAHPPASNETLRLAGPLPHVIGPCLCGRHTQMLDKCLSNKNKTHITIYTGVPKNLCTMSLTEFWSS